MEHRAYLQLHRDVPDIPHASVGHDGLNFYRPQALCLGIVHNVLNRMEQSEVYHQATSNQCTYVVRQSTQ